MNFNQVNYPTDKTIVDLFEEQVERTPDNIAIKFKETELTYSELNEKANQLAHFLINNYDIKPDDLVGLELMRSEWMVICVFAILKSGGAYVPIDPNYPEPRKKFIIEDACLKVILDNNELSSFQKWSSKSILPKTNPKIGLGPHNLIYVIYTSGSTGKPKGCMLEHRGLVNRLIWMQKSYELTSKDCVLHKTTFTFDVSVWELIWWSLQGACVSILELGCEGQPNKIISTIESSQVTVLHFVPSMLSVFLEYISYNIKDLKMLASLKQIYCSGEALQLNHVKKFKELLPDVNLMNLYGPTEASIDVSYYSCNNMEIESIPIGRAIDNIVLYVLDSKTQKIMSYGTTGEICIGGVGLARGYLNRPELTAEKFIENPNNKGERLYRTGDLGRWRVDGNLEYLGRIDDQVKIRGYRIELGEIEQVLSRYSKSGQVVVLARSINDSINKELIAYYTGHATSEELKKYLTENLPQYMVPAFYVKLDKIPLTGNGKFDRKALPTPENTGMKEVEYIAPNNKVESKLVKIVSNLLGIKETNISTKTDFFTSGGNSIKAILLLGKIHKQFGVKLDLKDLFSNTTIEELAKKIEDPLKIEEYISIPKISEESDYALSSSQRRLWTLSKLERANLAYNMPFIVRLNGPLDEKVFINSYNRIISRHDALRTVFAEDNQGYPKQKILSKNDARFFLNVIDLSLFEAIQKEEYIQKIILQELNTEFNLKVGPLIKCSLLKEKETCFVLVLVMHHIISDGWSMRVFQEELSELYNAEIENRNPSLKALDIQYKDYAYWHNDKIQADEVKIHKKFWIEQFKNQIPVLQFPSDKKRPKNFTYKGVLVRRELDENSTQKLLTYNQEHGGTMFMLLQTALVILLNKYTGQDDFVIGSPTAGRIHPDLNNQIGFYLGALPIRIQVNVNEDDFEKLYHKIKLMDVDVLSHQLYPFDHLVQDLDFVRDSSRNPLFDVWLDYHDKEMSIDNLFLKHVIKTDFVLTEIPVNTKFDMTFVFHKMDDKLVLNFEYNTDIYSHRQIERLLDNLFSFLANLKSFSENYIRDINILNPNEISAQFNAPLEISKINSNLNANSSLSKCFEKVIPIYSENIAIKCSSIVYSYSQINSLANQFANYLKVNYELKDEDIILLKLPRDEWIIIAMLGVMKIGCCFLPVDCKYPDNRINYIINDSKCVVVVDSEVIDHFKIERFVYSKDNLLSKPNPNQLAYCIYTSGSTGLPKGVLVEHNSIVNTINTQIQHFSIQSNDNTLFIASIAFDASISEIFTTLLSGASLHIIADDLQKDSLYIEKYLKNNYITHLTLTPTLLRNLDVNALLNLKKLISAGEIADYLVLSDLKRKGLSIINAYGPTEASICATIFHLDNLTKEHITIPIGKSIERTYIILLDENKQLVPYGSIGEICIGGAGLARGYLHRDELTSEKFILNPFNQKERIYLTGDLGRWRDDGNLEFVRRKDDQVKIRGHRIELGEIEQTIKNYDRKGNCIVLGKRLQNDGELELIAYITCDATVDELKTYLKDNLPDYMVPNYYVKLESIPLTNNGKVNREVLPIPEETGIAVPDYLPLVTDSQKILGQIWSEVLNLSIEKIGLNSDFFALGGDSIKAIQIVSKLRNSNLELKISDVMGQSKLDDMNNQLCLLKRKINQDAIEGKVHLNPIQKSFLENSFARGSQSAKSYYLQSFLLEFQKLIDISDIRNAIELLIRHHDVLRMSFKRNSDGDWEQYNNDVKDGLYILEEITLDYDQDRNLFFEINSIRLKEKLGFTDAPLLGIGLYHDKLKKHTFLLISIHHLIIDLVSWRIIFEDLETLLLQSQKGLPLLLPDKTDSFKFWMEQNLTYSRSYLIERQREYWKNITDVRTDRFKVNNPNGSNTFKYLKKANFLLTKEEMSLLYSGMNALNKVEINAMLLSALAQSLSEVFCIKNVQVLLEGHGREEYIDDIDITRTLGWFTSIFPVLINNEEKYAKTVFEIQDMLNKIPDNGVSYGLLRYLNSNPLEENRGAQISFNYLGDFTRSENKKNNLFDFSSFSHGYDFHPDLERETELEVIGQIQNGLLQISIQYSADRMDSNVTQKLIENFKMYLLSLSRELIDNNSKIEYPSKFHYKDLSFNIIKNLNAEYGDIEDIYELGSIQHGIYYTALAYPEIDAYFNQICYELRGQVDLEKLKESLSIVISRHGVLRSIFRDDIAIIPLQLVLKKGFTNFVYTDISEENDNFKDIYIRQQKDSERNKKFDLDSVSQIRMLVIKLSEKRYYQILSFHHIILDGWSVNKILLEIELCYNNLIKNKPFENSKITPFSKYIKCLNEVEKDSAKKYWNQYLKDFSKSTILSTNKSVKFDLVDKEIVDYDYDLSLDISRGLRQLSANNKVTLNSIIQSAWGLLVADLNNTSDAVFGQVVSGRNFQFDGIQDIIGVCINSIPQRIKFEDGFSFLDLLIIVHKNYIEGENFHYLSLTEIQKESRLNRKLFDHLLIFENYQFINSNNYDNLTIINDTVEIYEPSSFDFTLMVIPSDSQLKFRFKFNKNLYSENYINDLKIKLNVIFFEVIKNSSIKINSIRSILNINSSSNHMKNTNTDQKKNNLERLKSVKAQSMDSEKIINISTMNNIHQFPMMVVSELQGMDLNSWFKQNKSQIDQLIVSKGAVLFKNFNLKNKEDFAKFIKETVNLKSLSYVNRTSPRYSVAENVYTSTTQPATEIIHFHSENSYSKNPPSYLLFFCVNSAQTGGETPLADNRIVLKNISTQLKNKFLEKGILYKRRVNESLGLGWKEIFQVETKFEVEKHCKENDIDFNWDGESLNLYWKGSAISTHLKTNEEIWMNHAFFFHKLSYSQTLLDVIESDDELPFLTYFGDGSEISEDEYFELKSAYDKAKVEFSWEKGDLLLVDNYLISHSRNSYTGDREILVSIF